MAMMIAGAVIAAGVAAGTAAFKGAGERKALSAQETALGQTQALSPVTTLQASRDVDATRLAAALDAQRRYDPGMAQVRALSVADLIRSLKEGNGQSQMLLDKLVNENKNEDPEITKLRQGLVTRANEELKLGGKLPAEVQAELVQAGLENATQAGKSTDPNSNTGGDLKELIGTAALNLRQQRSGTAAALGTTAQGMAQSRAAILSGLVNTVEGAKTARAARAAGSFQLAQDAMPGGGLSGSDIANLMWANNEFLNHKVLAMGDLRAQKELSHMRERIGYLNAGGSALSGMMGGMGGGGSGGGGMGGMMGGGGGGGGGMGGIMSMFGGMGGGGGQ